MKIEYIVKLLHRVCGALLAATLPPHEYSFARCNEPGCSKKNFVAIFFVRRIGVVGGLSDLSVIAASLVVKLT